MADDDRTSGLRLAGVGLEFAAAVAGLSLLGYWIDRHFGTGPWGLLIGAGIGLDPFTVRRHLATGAEAEQVHADNLRAHRLGINGVPCFVVGGRNAIAGAQEPEVLERLLDVALVDC